MNRKNLTAAVLAGLAGAAGLAGTAQAVNLNPDGLGQVLIYPYYTTNGGNQTVLSVVNTTDQAKAVKVRFLEGFNSREVLDFNLYMSAEDVWTAAVFDGGDFFPDVPEVDGVPHLVTYDNSCTVPYLYESGPQAFLSIAYIDNGIPEFNFEDGGPTTIARASEGHFEMIEMGTMVGESAIDATHQLTPAVKDKDGNETRPPTWEPKDCAQLVENWTRTENFGPLGMWTCDVRHDTCAKNRIDIERNSGGLFGGASIVNSDNGTMFSYNAAAIQGFDKTDGHLHREPGSIQPNLNDGDQDTAYVFFGVPQNKVAEIGYVRPVGAVSAVFMHEHIMNEYTVEDDLAASTEWVITFPTKSFYADPFYLTQNQEGVYWFPTPETPLCNNWEFGDDNPVGAYNPGGPKEGINPNDDPPVGWDFCFFQSTLYLGEALPPFTEEFFGSACEDVTLTTWDREERTFTETTTPGTKPPVVSPSLPCLSDCDPVETPFQLCYETNVLRFGGEDAAPIFHTPNFFEGPSTGDAYYGLLLTVTDPAEFPNGWGRIDFYNGNLADFDDEHVDEAGLVGLPVTGFAAMEFENEFLGDGSVKAFYGGLFNHKANVRRISEGREPEVEPPPGTPTQ